MNFLSLGSGSAGNAHLLNHRKTTILLDAGLPFRELQRRSGYKITNIAAALITHEHGDHSRAVHDLLKRGIPVCASAGTFDALGVERSHLTQELEPHRKHEIGNFSVLPFPIVHDAAEPLAFIIDSPRHRKRAVYITDTAYVEYRIPEMTHLIVECNYMDELLAQAVAYGRLNPTLAERIAKTHMSLETLSRLLKSNDTSKLERVYITHMSNAHGDSDKTKSTVAELTGAIVEIL
jgi:phosphoribosyl 1,2-cyclic phosphodiesterase